MRRTTYFSNQTQPLSRAVQFPFTLSVRVDDSQAASFSYTLETWFRLEAWANAPGPFGTTGSESAQMLFLASGPQGYSFLVRLNNNGAELGALEFSSYAGGVLRSAALVPVGAWVHVRCTYDNATFEGVIYLNNQVVAQGFFAAAQYSISALNLGHIDSNRSVNNVNGQMDETRLWPYVRSAAQNQASWQLPNQELPDLASARAAWSYEDPVPASGSLWTGFADSSGHGLTLLSSTNGYEGSQPYSTVPFQRESAIPRQALLGWWRADRGLQPDGAGHVVLWSDQSGNGHDLVPDPAYQPPTVVAWGEVPAILFEGQQIFALVDLNLPSPPEVYTLVLAMQKTPGAIDVMPAAFGADFGTANNLGAGNDTFGLNTFVGDVVGITGAEQRVSRPIIVTAELHSNHPEAFRLWLNGQSQVVAPVLNTAVAHPLDAVFRLGGNTYHANGDYLWKGVIAEALLYNRVLNDLEQAQLATELAGRYALGVAPEAESVHNYRFTFPPTATAGDWVSQSHWLVGHGQATITGGEGVNGDDFLYQDIATETGATYEAVFWVSSYTSGTLYIDAVGASLPTGVYNTGLHRYHFVASAASIRFHLVGANNAVFSLGFFSIRKSSTP